MLLVAIIIQVLWILLLCDKYWFYSNIHIILSFTTSLLICFESFYFVTQTFIVFLYSFDSFIRNFLNEVKVNLHLQFSPPAVAVSHSLFQSVTHSVNHSLTHSISSRETLSFSSQREGVKMSAEAHAWKCLPLWRKSRRKFAKEVD